MRTQTREYLGEFIKDKEIASVLEVGSLDVNGTIKDLFPNVRYVGTDMRKGDNVDIIVNGHDLYKKFRSESFDLAICVDTLEHDDKFWETVEQLKRVVKKGGWVFIGVPSRFCPEHDHPHDFWRFMPQGVVSFLDGFIDIESKIDRNKHHLEFEDEIYVWGRKPLT